MTDSLSQAMYETSVILDNTEKRLIDKIPEKVINSIKSKAKMEREFVYDTSRKLKDQDITDMTRGLLAIIYRDYFCDEQERKIYNEFYRTAVQQAELEKQEKYSADKIFQNKKNQRVATNMSLVPYEKETIWTKIANKLKHLFKK